ncbi:hypothetical protein TPHA_0H00550 [Tetrapisispora phaffii CBS 4417]|uniref:Protein YIP n=1 Tax=Tetrapisispora phaffii (strain ATCC 24235 / CBS 4417 / NBRC 1672 / NRRL Y-8282 / UCD 70-5) TaxID=1071381 RepID=G8BWW1_TETPH|nr:hypothetical protein TPHA_0H00550 [Tetrapisispora phaffii CBS 4417]CCE64265.1 hypothetical protein TPHA_0H00550 [Tetrapisispora phaffii CBS 4417]
MTERHNNSFEIDDDLDGVDDFTNDNNPFETVRNSKITNNNISSDRIENDSDFDIEVPKVLDPEPISNIPPLLYDQVRVDEQDQNDELPPGFLNYYSKYFQLSDQEFKRRLYNAARFTKSEEIIPDSESNNDNNSNKQTDLYAAIWVTASVIMVQFFTNNLFNLILNDIAQGIKSTTNIDRKDVYSNLLHSIWLFFGYTFIVPFISYQILKKDENTKFKSTIDLISVYGYSNLNWIPILFAENVLSKFGASLYVLIIKWVFFPFGLFKSALYLFYATQNNNNSTSRFPLSVIIILSIHVLFSSLMMFILFY